MARWRDAKKGNIKPQEKTKSTKDNNKDTTFLISASPLFRIKAFITDMFMIYAPVLYIITYLFMGGKDDFQTSQYAPLIGVSIYGLIYAILLTKLGQTPGKKAYTMKVVDAKTKENIGFFRAILRFISFLFSATILFGLLVPFYRKDNRALHDLISGTIVIAVDK